MDVEVPLVQVDEGCGLEWAKRLPEARLSPWRAAEATVVAAWPGKLAGCGLRCGSLAVLSLSGAEGEAAAACAELCLRQCATLRELAQAAREVVVATGAAALLAAAQCEGGEWAVLAVRSAALVESFRLWRVSSEGSLELLPAAQLPRRRGVMGLRRGRGAVLVGCSVAAGSGPWLLLATGGELAFPGDHGAALRSALGEKSVAGHLAAISSDGFGGGATMVACELSGQVPAVPPQPCALLLAHLAAQATARAAAPCFFAQSDAPPEPPFALHTNVPLTISIAQTATQLIIMCQTLSSSTLSVAAEARAVDITMAFPDEPRIRAELAEPDAVALGAAEFFGPVTRRVALPVAIDPESKIMVYDRNDGIVNIKYDLL